MREDLKRFNEPLICLSTLHVSKETCDSLDGRTIGNPIHYPNEYGAFIYVLSDFKGPDDLARVLNFAASEGFIWVKLDPDGAVLADLPIYESTWETK